MDAWDILLRTPEPQQTPWGPAWHNGITDLTNTPREIIHASTPEHHGIGIHDSKIAKLPRTLRAAMTTLGEHCDEYLWFPGGDDAEAIPFVVFADEIQKHVTKYNYDFPNLSRDFDATLTKAVAALERRYPNLLLIIKKMEQERITK